MRNIPWTALWTLIGVQAAIVLLQVAGVELPALLNNLRGDTASEHVWALVAAHESLRYIGTAIGTIFTGALAWATYHFFWQKR